jgi:hypothetical protein
VILANRILAALRVQLGPDRMLPPGAVSGVMTILLYLPATASTTTALLGPPHVIAAAAGATVAASSAIGLLAVRLVIGAICEGRKGFHAEGGAAYRGRRLRGRGEPLRVMRALTSVGYDCTGPVTAGLRGSRFRRDRRGPVPIAWPAPSHGSISALLRDPPAPTSRWL